MDNHYNEEKERLIQTKEKINKLIKIEEHTLSQLPKKYKSDINLLENFIWMSTNKISNLKRSELKPYFARIDFRQSGTLSDEKLYIGKVGVISEEGNIVVTDWRAPIATLYYDNNLGKCSYDVQGEKIIGELQLKRQLVIENGKIVEIFDVDSVSDDELLKPYLGSNTDNRLKNIVASIQSEQNSIIRENINKNIIVQGVAGSGKTTVALHRIAYLVYNYKDKYKPYQFMVIGPNKFFIKYISTVLPDLDVGNARQLTYEELAAEFIEEKINIQNSADSIIIDGKKVPYYYKYKTSIKYKEAIDRFIEDYQQEIIYKDFKINGYTIFKVQELRDVYNLYLSTPAIISRVNMTIKTLSNKIKMDRQIDIKIKEYFDNEIKKNKDDFIKIKELTEKKWDSIDKLKNGAIKELRKHIKVLDSKVLSLYKKFINNIDKYIVNNDLIIYEKELLKKETLNCIDKKSVGVEEIAALVYLKMLLFGTKKYQECIHAVIDESQDFGTFSFYVLKKIMPNSTFSIFGDITQGIYSYRAIDKWSQVQQDAFDNKCEIMHLEKSYRTTIEIMLSANLVSNYIGLGEGKPVIRHGETVKVVHITKEESKIEYIVDKIKHYKEKGYKSIAIICKSANNSCNIQKMIQKHNIDIYVISNDDEEYKGGVCIVTSYLAKGLEFDSVIVYEADEIMYSSSNNIDMKLLYVSMTRALHTLDIIYSDNLTKPLLALENKAICQ
ncbi:MAG: RNA polymerase recycling motor HelD [Clostridia bacterium]